MYIIHDGPAPETVTDVVTEFEDKRLILCETKERKANYGHPNRKMMLEQIPAEPDDLILLTNDDNYYVRIFVDTMLKTATRTVGMVYCDMLHNYYNYDILKTELRINKIDMGAFVVKADIAKKIGFNSMKFEADGIYCEACVKECVRNGLRVLKVEKVLFVHN